MVNSLYKKDVNFETLKDINDIRAINQYQSNRAKSEHFSEKCNV